MLRRLIFGLLIVFSLQSVARAADAIGPGAGKFISDLAHQAIQTLQTPGLPMIGRFVLGQAYRKLSPEEQAEYQQLFAEFVLKTYSYRLGGYKGESFNVVSTQVVGEQDVLVRTRIDRPQGAPVQCDWRVRVIDGRYKIVDVLVEGISMAVTQRSDFASVVQNNGTSGLLEALRARVARFPAKGPG